MPDNIASTAGNGLVTTTESSDPPRSAAPRAFTSDVPARLDRLPWSRWHWLVLVGLGTVWILDGLEVTIVGAVGSTLTQSGSGISITTAQVGDAAGIYIAGACVGALFFGHLTDRLGRRKLFLVTLGLYLAATVLTATSREVWMFFLFRFFTGMGIGGEYAAINSAIDELIPARVRGTVDLLVNGSYWLGTAAGAAATLVLLNPSLIPINLGWRLCFLMGAILGLGVLFVRRHLPESPRWLLTHGHADEADRIVHEIEDEVTASTGEGLDAAEESIKIDPDAKVGLFQVFRTLFVSYPRRTALGLSLFVGQAFLYNAVFFTFSLVLSTFYGVSASSVGYYLIAFAVGNFLGPLLLGRLFDVVGRRLMIAGTYLLSGAMLALTAYLFEHGVLTATTQTIAWVVVFFFASAGASSAYLTVSEIFPMETRALAIAIFYAVGTGLGGIIGPVLFGHLIATKRPGPVAFGYLLGGVLMFGAGVVELFFGVNAEQRSLEEISSPLTEVDSEAPEAESHAESASPRSPRRQTGRTQSPRQWSRPSGWAPSQLASTYPAADPYLAREVESLVAALEQTGPQSGTQLAQATAARFWGPGRLRHALRSGIASGRIRRVGRDSYVAGRSPVSNG